MAAKGLRQGESKKTRTRMKEQRQRKSPHNAGFSSKDLGRATEHCLHKKDAIITSLRRFTKVPFLHSKAA